MRQDAAVRRALARGPVSFVAPGFVSGEHFIWGATSMIKAELAVIVEEALGDRAIPSAGTR